MAYARGTKVPIARSREEIERTVLRYNADQFGSAMGKKTDPYCDQCRKPKPLIQRGKDFIVPWKIEYADDRPDFQDEEYWFCSFDCLRAWALEKYTK